MSSGPCNSMERRFAELFTEMYSLCRSQGWGDPFSYARAREIYIANVLGHRIHNNFSGPDGHDQEGNACEYKTTTGQKIQGTYNGISYQDTWEKQFDYLKNEKIACYRWHYFARFDGPDIVELWKMDGDKVLELITPSIRKKYWAFKKNKDPRLGVTLTKNQITTFGMKIDIQ
jgi:hypothetical protein